MVDRDIKPPYKHKKVQVGNEQEMAQSERNYHSINRGVEKNLMPMTLTIIFIHFQVMICLFFPVGSRLRPLRCIQRDINLPKDDRMQH